MENDPAKENLGVWGGVGGWLSACDLHQAALSLQLSRVDPNHGSPAIKVILITIGLAVLYLDHFLEKRKAVVFRNHRRRCRGKGSRVYVPSDLGFSDSSHRLVNELIALLSAPVCASRLG